MTRHKDVPTRHEISERIESKKKGMDEKEVKLEKVTEDLDTIIKTLENLDFKGTLEGTQEVKKSIDSAEDVTSDVFHEEDENLNQIQSDTKEYRGELEDRHGASESDLGSIKDADSRIDTSEALKELDQAKEAALQDIKYLATHIIDIQKALRESQSVREKLQGRVQSSKRR